MKLYAAIDLHSTNNVTVVIDEQDRVVYQKRLPNDLALIVKELSVYQSEIEGIVVESTYNWYWLVDGLMEQGYKVHLANTAAIQQYEGLKYTDDHSDARWLAHLLRLGVLPEGYIYPRADRPVRDLLRKRGQMVRQRTTNLLSIQNLLTRNTGSSLNANRVKRLDVQQVDELLPNGDLALALKANLSVMCSADEQVELLEQTVTQRVELRPQFSFLKTVPGIGEILALTIMLETGDIRRFASVGNFASYCRCVGSQKISNGKKKGQGNTKNGNKYLAWAFLEAAHFAIRFNSKIKSFDQRKKAKSKAVVAIKAVAHKLCRACYYIMRDRVAFDITKAFGPK
ncbi:MAG: IS110 family transposase [Aquabacterium sp.]|uniref:IS110 family transposase n=1 Tax=Aquabacterium sp. TaxID=1872578 RepID=UPI00121B25C3|nr:IS110 family transposase [Aquabacterium sp.]TAK83773.1 MAG: IS110 family transposase [Aquabacterium sp.]